MKLLSQRYEVIALIGRGGQGDALRALDHRHNRHVVLKRRPVNPESREALLSEVRVLLDLDPHPALPSVRDEFFEEDHYYLVMDWVSGTNLETVIAERGDPGLPVSTVMGYLTAIADALNHLHGQTPPIVHGDVKPSNLILTDRGKVVLVDFGSAVQANDKLAVRTAWFSAPEVAQGGKATPASDIFGLAATAFALLTGTAPKGERPSWEGIPAWSASAAERVIFRGLSTDPSRRPGSASDFVESLRSRLQYSLPSGTLTFLLTDLEGSTRLWEQEPEAMKQAIARHDDLLPEILERQGGYLPLSQGEGDSAMAVFELAGDAASAALQLQIAFLQENWPTERPLRLRVGLATGEAQIRDGDYHGAVVSRCARIRSLAHGGQILVSETTADLLKDTLRKPSALRALGAHRLKDLSRPEQIYELIHPDLPAEFPALQSVDAIPNNLPVQLSSFVGRAEEILELKEIMAKARYITLVGPGGAGKTRLALQVAVEIQASNPDGVWFIDLAPIREEELVAETVAATLGIRETAGRTPLDAVRENLRSRRTLLILDNCEHVIQSAAVLIESLLQGCPEVRVLATSREVLGTTGEAVWRIPPLQQPGAEETRVESLEAYESVALFIDRASAHQPDFSLTEENARFVAEICRRLDGLPLAIELAAARVRMLSVEDIAARLDEKFRLLSGGSRTAPERHQTLRALIDWSYELLGDQEKLLLARLSVFAGTFTLEGAEAVAAGESLDRLDIVDVIGTLADKSLIAVGDRYGQKRYQLLNTVREYSAEKLSLLGRDLTQERFVQWMVTAAEGEGASGSADTEAQLERLADERENLRAALDWSLKAGMATAALRLAIGASRLWEQEGPFTEGRKWLDAALASAPPGQERLKALALRAASVLAMKTGDYAGARHLVEKALNVHRALSDTNGIAQSLQTLGEIAARLGEHERARSMFEESLSLGREGGDLEVVLQTLIGLGAVALDEADLPAARSVFEEGLEIARGLGRKRLTSTFLNQLGRIAQLEGDYGEALRIHEDAMSLTQEDQLVASMAFIARIALIQGRYENAAQLLKEALEIAEQKEALPEIAAIRFQMALARELTGELDVAGQSFHENLKAWRDLNSLRGISSCLEHLGTISARKGEFENAQASLQESLSIRRELGHRLGIAASLQGLGDVFRGQKEWGRAAARYRESLRLRGNVNHRLGITESLERLGICGARRSSHADACKLLAAAAALRSVMGAVIPPIDSSVTESEVATLRSTLGEPTFEMLWQEGREMPINEAIALADASNE